MKFGSNIRFKVLMVIFGALLLMRAGFVFAGDSPDMIGIRVLPNQDHYSADVWYGKQKFSGSPQEILIDGYRGVRDGNTVYVNAATISGICMNAGANRCSSNSDCGNDACSRDYFETKIFIISMSAGFDKQTSDIFGQILKNWHFNTNLNEPDKCSSNGSACFIDADCEVGYCLSKKAQATRDTVRLADIVEVKAALDNYKASTGKYPVIKSGSYLPNVSMSAWPSWQTVFAKMLGSNLPLDPVNKIGACPGFDSDTCYNSATKKFATNYSYASRLLPVGSKLYAYSVNDVGTAMNFCGAFESNYANLASVNCFEKSFNHPPVIVTTQFIGSAKKEFSGFATGYDSDGDYLNWTIDLVNPVNSSDWINAQNLWQWDDGASNFRIVNMLAPNLKQFHAKRAGRAKLVNIDKVRITLSDGHGGTTSKEVDVVINPVPMTATNPTSEILIGQTVQMDIAATDSSNEPLSNFIFNGATLVRGLSTTTVSEADLLAMGVNFQPNNLKLNVVWTSEQKTGDYKIIALFTDVYTARTITGSFNLSIKNHPPVFNATNFAKITFGNNTIQNCDLAQAVCNFSIDNLEPAKMNVLATDNDANHTVRYRFKTAVPAGLLIDPITGAIKGFEALNARGLSAATTSFTVEAFDQYCNNSFPDECSVSHDFKVVVMPYCSINETATTLKGADRAVYPKLNNEIAYQAVDNLKNCSVAKAVADLTLNGDARSKSIVVVSDLSDSMKNGTPLISSPRAIDQLKVALGGANGLIDRLLDIATHLPNPYTLTLGTVAFNAVVTDYTNLTNILTAGTSDYIKNHIASYSENYQTNTLSALNKAEGLLLQEAVAPKKDRVVVLISDGMPVVGVSHVIYNHGCYRYEGCNQCGSPPNCTTYGAQTCPTGQGACYCSCNSLTPTYANPNCSYWTTCGWEGCYYPTCVSNGSCAGRCNCTDNCGYTTPPCSSKNTKPAINFYSELLSYFDAHKTLANVIQTQCVADHCADYDSCPTTCSTGNPASYCGYALDCAESYDSNCSLESNTSAQAAYLKNTIGAKLYSVYFDTLHNGSGRQEMANWSSDNGNTSLGKYFFEGTNITGMLDSVLRDILIKPRNITINNVPVVDPLPYAIINTIQDAALTSTQMCMPGFNGFNIQYSSEGVASVSISNLKYEYCPLRLHP